MSKARKVENEDGSVTYLASDGREFKSKSGAWKHSTKIGKPVEEAVEPEPKPETPQPEADSDSGLDWSSMDFSEGIASEVIPGPLKRIRPRGSGKPSKKQLEAERGMNEGILKTGYKTGDWFLTRYKRGVLNDDEAEAITHEEDDYDWIAGITQDALDHNGVNLAGVIGPNQIAILSNAYWFGSPVMKINAEAGRSVFSGGRVASVLERVPFLGKRIKARRMRKIEERMLREME